MSPRFARASSVAVLLASHHACGFEQGVDQHVPREQSAPRLGFLDCTGQSDLTDRGIRRAYRRIAKAKHPDKQRRGHLSVAPAEADPPEEESEGAGTIEDFTELRDSWLQDPLRFHIYRAVFDRDGGRLTEFGDAVTRKEHSQKSAPAVLQTLRARIERVRDSTPSRGTDKDADTADRNNTSAPFASEKDDLASTTSVAAQRQAQETEKDWPYLDVEIDVRNSGAPNGGFLPQGGSWTFAFARKGVSTVHYRGDEKAGGYDVCCDFLKDSKCVRNTGIQHTKGADGKLRSSESPGPRSPQVQASSQNGSLPYQTSDCPFARDRETLTFRVRKPLHKDLGGQWGGAVQVFNERREEVLCVALALQAGPPHQPPAHGESASSPGAGRGAPGPSSEGAGSGQRDGHRDGPGAARASRGPPSGERPGPPPRFRFLEAGSFCEDGADLLEGPLDGYGGGHGPGAGGLFAGDARSGLYGEKCRAKCLQRPRCRFYTAYSSGWCQLSTRCSRRQRTGDPLTVTFAKEAGGIPAPSPRSTSADEL